MGALKMDKWVIATVNGFDVITCDGTVAAKMLWLRELRYPNMCRARMSAALNDHPIAGPDDRIRPHRQVPRGQSWTADGAEKVWLLLHNGAVIGELHTAAPGSSAEYIRDGVLEGLNMRPGRRPEACEPMPVTPVTERHLRLVR